MKQQATKEEVPIPLIECGDWVRLKQDYSPSLDARGSHRQFTHGIVVEVISRIGISNFASAQTEIVGAWGNRDPPAERVSLHLFNPDTGLMYLGGHPSEPAKPEFVDHHICELILLHKATETWGRDVHIDVAEQYDNWGITVPQMDDE